MLWFLISRLIKYSRQEFKDGVSLWLNGGNEKQGVQIFIDWFDSIFGPVFNNKLNTKFAIPSIRFAFSSAIVSVLSLGILYLLAVNFFGLLGESGRFRAEFSFLDLLLLSLVYNLIPDYFSQIETRFVLGKISKVSENSRIWKIIWIVMDVIFTALIIWCWLNMINLMWGKDFVSIFSMFGLYNEYSLFFYSTFFTSIFSWGFWLSKLNLRILQFITRKFNFVFDAVKNPEFVLGFTMSLSIIMIFFVIKFIATPLLPKNIDDLICKISARTCVHTAELTENEIKKMEHYIRACTEGYEPEFCFEKGEAKFLENPIAALSYLMPLCQNKHIKSCEYVGGLYASTDLRYSDLSASTLDVMSTFCKEKRSSVICGSLGTILSKSNSMIDLNRAEHYFLKGIGLDDKNSIIHIRYAKYLITYGRLKEAEKHFKLAIDSKPKHYAGFLEYSIFLDTHGRMEDADTLYVETLKKYPQVAYYNYLYALRLDKQNKPTEAEVHYKKIISLKPNIQAYNSIYAQFLDKNKNIEQADIYYKKAYDCNQEDYSALFRYIIFLFRAENQSKAMPYLERMFSLLDKESVEIADQHRIILWFYIYASFPSRAEVAEKEIQILLDKGVRVEDWDFSGIMAITENETKAKKIKIFTQNIVNN